ncbi:histidine phosphatase family protein [Skermanella pratensis]|uniref:histidine phosphatase family protein n=1 Tax=Skermanella pratensis TaxID=2233999 RepID=UPI001787FA14|nr:histidine phosphatase family protein [Skermanella pratensis]
MSAQAEELKGDALFSALKNGGYVIYIRHALSDTSQNDADPIDVANCQTQRNLSAAGKDQARAIGKAMQERGIAVDAVMTSAYCRAKETGTLAFGDIQTSDALFYSLGLSKDDAAKAADQLKKIIGTAPPAGKNTVLVGHTSNIKEVAGVWPKTEGGAFVMEPKGAGNFAVVGSFSAEDLIKTAN